MSDPPRHPPSPAPGPTRGRFIAFEGGEASGKSTQSRRLAERLGAVLTREPGGTAVGSRIRELLLDRATTGLADRTEALLMAADRAQHVAELVRPALAGGRHVVTDRFIGSSLAYQGFGRGLPLDEIWRLSRWATEDLEPDLVVLLDVPGDVAAGRRDLPHDRMEAAGAAFHEAVRNGYRQLAVDHADGWEVVDGSRSLDEVSAAVAEAVARRLPDLAPDLGVGP